jgi:4a-hydroxytetrahydrobiopterin dehydratase
MVRIGTDAEKADHQPEWFIVYNPLDIWLTTRHAAGVSLREIELARQSDLRAAFGRRSVPSRF